MNVNGCKIVTAADCKALHADLLLMFYCPTAFCNIESSICTLRASFCSMRVGCIGTLRLL